MYCSNCGKEIDDKAAICVHCGVPTGGSALVSGNKNWVTTLLLCLFLGGVGAHRFYTGHTGTAILQLVLTFSFIGIIISAPWAFIDLICIICGNFKTSNGCELSR